LKIIISPAKKMKINTDFEIPSMPYFKDKTYHLYEYLQGLSYMEAKALWKCNDAIAEKCYRNLKNVDLHDRITPALLAYEGIQYQYMAPSVFETEQWNYIKEHLYILSGFYGLLKPLDGIIPYRLEMQAGVKLQGYKDLYEFWGDSLYKKLYEDTQVVINLASKEYSKCIENYLTDKVQFINCIFGEYKDGKIITKGTFAKMARGEMVRFMAENKVEDISEIKQFNRMGYQYQETISDNKNFIFIKD
jgi:uncharacterized protein